MNLEELQDALDVWDEMRGYMWQAIPNEEFEAIVTCMEAARLVADPNIEAAQKWMDDYFKDIGYPALPPDIKYAVAAAFTRDLDSDDQTQVTGTEFTPPGDTDES